jgi:hypothetical protein
MYDDAPLLSEVSDVRESKVPPQNLLAPTRAAAAQW